MKKLISIQTELKAPKGQLNKFGGYHYRSCEDILQAAKPLCAEQGLSLIVTDEIVEIGGRIYVKATATVSDGEFTASASGYAREADTKKGMDESQITGAASSYARKYALNGLFAIDDTKDADHTNTHGTTPAEKPAQKPKIDPESVCAGLAECTNLSDLASAWKALSSDERNHPAIIKCKDEFKAAFEVPNEPVIE